MERALPSRTTLGFLAGMGVTAAGLFVLPPILGGAGFFAGASGARPLLALIAAAVIGGAIAGASVRPARRGMVAFGLAFPLGLFFPFLLVLGTQALSGREPPFVVLAGTLLSFGLSFGVLGGLGTACLGRGWWLAARATVVFAGAGAVGGAVLGLATVLLARADSNAALVTVATVLAFLVPAALAGRQLGRILNTTADPGAPSPRPQVPERTDTDRRS